MSAPPNLTEFELRSWKMERFTQNIVESLQQYHCQDLKAAQDRIKKLEVELAAAQNSAPAPSNPNKRQAPDQEQSEKISEKKQRSHEGPKDLHARAVNFEAPVPSPLPFAVSAPTSHTKQSVNSFVSKLSLDKDKKQTLSKAIAEVPAKLKELSAEQTQHLINRAAQYGLPVSICAKAKPSELYTLLLVAVSCGCWLRSLFWFPCSVCPTTPNSHRPGSAGFLKHNLTTFHWKQFIGNLYSRLPSMCV